MRALWLLEFWGVDRWYIHNCYGRLSAARFWRNKLFKGETTRIQKWVRPRKGK